MKKDLIPLALLMLAGSALAGIIGGAIYCASVKGQHSAWVRTYNAAEESRQELKAHITKDMTEEQADLVWFLHRDIILASENPEELELVVDELRTILPLVDLDPEEVLVKMKGTYHPRLVYFMLRAEAQDAAAEIMNRPCHHLLLRILGEETPRTPFL